jgi:hypothetical protein
VSDRDGVVAAWADRGDHGGSKRVSRAEPYRREVRSWSGSAGSVRAPVSTTRSPSGASTVRRCVASFGSSSAHDLVRRVDEHEVVRARLAPELPDRVGAGDPRAREASASRGSREIVRQAAGRSRRTSRWRRRARAPRSPCAPEPAKRSSTGASVDRPIRLKAASRTRSPSAGWRALSARRSGRPRWVPAITLMQGLSTTPGCETPGNRDRAGRDPPPLPAPSCAGSLDALAPSSTTASPGGASVATWSRSRTRSAEAFEGFGRRRRAGPPADSSPRSRRGSLSAQAQVVPRADAEPAATAARSRRCSSTARRGPRHRRR